jgi:hypothetical protein
MAVFMVLNFGLVQVLFFFFFFIFFFCIKITTARLDLYSGAYLNKFPASKVLSDLEYPNLKGPPGQMFLCLTTETELASETQRLFKQLDN